MNNDNGFGLLIDVIFDINSQQGGLGPKVQDLVISFCLGKGKNLPQLNLRALHIRGETFLFQYQTRKINNLSHLHHETYKLETSSKIHDSLFI